MTHAFLSINDVSKQLDVPAHTLRYWEKQFPTAIKPATGAGGRRYYRPETVTALEQIKALLYDRGMTIAGVKKILKEGLPFPMGRGAAEGGGVGVNNELPTPARGKSSATPSQRKGNSPDISRAIELLELARAELK